MIITNRKPMAYIKAFKTLCEKGIEFAKKRCNSRHESVSIERATGRITAIDILAKETLPELPLSERDGYAFTAPESGASYPVTLTLRDEIRAGVVHNAPCKKDEAFRIFTGAPLPEDSNTVLMQEFASIKTGDDGQKQLVLDEPYYKDKFVREPGCDCVEGDVLIKKGTRIRAEHTGLLASLGIVAIKVKKKPQVAFLITGDELVCATSTTVPPGMIRNSNLYLIASLIKEAGGNPLYLGTISDKREVLLETMRNASDCDILVTVGGASVGDYDYVLSCAEELEYDMQFSRIALKPGKPTLFGIDKDKLFVGLPGHPVSAAVIFNLMVKPLMAIISGETDWNHRTSTALLAEDEKKEVSRQFFLPGTIKEIDGEVTATPSPWRHSSSLQSLTESKVLIVLPAGVDFVKKGSEVTVYHIW